MLIDANHNNKVAEVLLSLHEFQEIRMQLKEERINSFYLVLIQNNEALIHNFGLLIPN